MDTITCIKTRRSIRQFKEQEVTKDVLEDIVQTASFAPSWKKHTDYPLYCHNGP